MNRSSGELMVLTLALLLQFGESSFAQEDWPHSSVDWDDPLFQARVQGVYDWVNSGPGQILIDLESTISAVPAHMSPTANRDLQSFPPRAANLVDGTAYNEPKDWADRRFLIDYMQSNESIEPGFFEDRLDERTGVDTHYLMANVYFLQGRLEDAIVHYEMAIEEFPFFRLAYKNTAYAHMLLGNCEAALENATEAVSLGALSTLLKNLQAHCAFEKGDFAMAAEAAAMSLTLDPANAAILRLQVHALNELGYYTQALALVEGLPNREERETTAVELQLLAATHANESEEKLALLEIKSRMLELTPSEEAELVGLKLSSGLAGTVENDHLNSHFQSERLAATELESFLKSLIDSGQPLPPLLEQQELPNSIRDKAMTAPGNEIEMLRARVEMQAGNLDQANSILLRSLEINPMHCESLILLSKIAHLQGDDLASQSYATRASASSRECDNASLEQRALLSIADADYPQAQNYMLRDWNQKIAKGEIPNELYLRRFRAITSLGNLTSE